MLQDAIVEAARYQRRDNRSKNAARLQMLEEKGMMVEKVVWGSTLEVSIDPPHFMGEFGHKNVS